MSTTKRFEHWQTPKWHPHLGDPEAEICLLKEFCMKASEMFPILEFSLDAFEEGYICVDILQDGAKILELHVTDISTRQLGLFSFVEPDKDEKIFTDFSTGMSFISELVTK